MKDQGARLYMLLLPRARLLCDDIAQTIPTRAIATLAVIVRSVGLAPLCRRGRRVSAGSFAANAPALRCYTARHRFRCCWAVIRVEGQIDLCSSKAHHRAASAREVTEMDSLTPKFDVTATGAMYIWQRTARSLVQRDTGWHNQQALVYGRCLGMTYRAAQAAKHTCSCG